MNFIIIVEVMIMKYFYFVSPVGLNTFYGGGYTDYKCYYFNKLSYYKFKEFYRENNLSEIWLYEYYSYETNIGIFFYRISFFK